MGDTQRILDQVDEMTDKQAKTTTGSESALNDLLCCPLCGKQPKLIDLAGWEIWCNCGLTLCLDSATKGSLIKHWNTRAT